MSAMNRNSATGPGAHTPDGCSVELYKMLRDNGEAALIHNAVPSNASILELGAGAGRVTHELVRLGHNVTAVDVSWEMLAEIHGARTVQGDIATLRLPERFEAVVLGSYLVNVPEHEIRRAFLDTCAAHVRPDGVVLIERHPRDVFERARRGALSEEGGIVQSWRSVERDGDMLRGTLEWRVGECVWTQTFTTQVMSDEELAEDLDACGLRFRRSLGKLWIEAAPLVR